WGAKGSHLGDGTKLRIDDPRSLYLPHPQAVPVLVVGGVSFAAVSAGGGFHTCGVMATGAAYCWGSNGFGQLGDGAPTNMDNSTNVPVPVAGGLSFAAVRHGHDHTCRVTTAGATYCWGRGSMLTAGLAGPGGAYCWGGYRYGHLGDGTTPSRSPPGPASGVRFAAVGAGGCFHTCGVTATGVAYCWGDNHAGQLGDGTTT